MRVSRLLPMLSLAVAFAMPALAGGAAAAGPREALVIGNSAYPDSDEILKTPVADADVMARALAGKGFEVTTVKNGTRRQMQAAIDGFLDKIGDGSDVAIFYAGHGIQVGRKNYLVPVDARIWSESDVLRDGLSIDVIVNDAARKGAQARVVILDASRRNPFERRFRGLSAGLAAATPRSGVLAISSASAGRVADDPDAESSPFVTELRKQIGVASLSAEQAFQATRDGLARATQNTQVPAVVAGLEAPFFFDPAHAPADAKVAAPVTPEVKPNPAATAKAPAPKTEVTRLEPPADLPKSRPDPGPPAPSAPPVATVVPPPETRPAAPPPVVAVRPYAPEEGARKAQLDAAIARNPRDKASIAERGELLAQHGEYGSAFADFDRAVRLDPKNVEVLNNRCWVRAVRNELHLALADCNDALRMRGDFADAYDSRGLIYLKLGQPRAALADYDAALRIDPSHSSALYGRGIAKLRLGEKREAERDFASALGLNGTIDKDYAQFGVH